MEAERNIKDMLCLKQNKVTRCLFVWDKNDVKCLTRSVPRMRSRPISRRATAETS